MGKAALILTQTQRPTVILSTLTALTQNLGNYRMSKECKYNSIHYYLSSLSLLIFLLPYLISLIT